MSKTILITGANRGIGLELAKQLSARGDKVIAAVRTASPELEALDIRIESGVDVADDDLGGLPARLTDTKLDVVINNAGVLSFESLSDLSLEGIRKQFEVNAIGPLKFTHAVLDHVEAGAKIALITSRMGSITDNTSGGSYGYRMSKCALNMAGTSLAHDLKKRGIAVCLLHPGFVRTDMTRGSGNIGADEAAKGLIARIDGLTMETTGTFWHQNGEVLPW